MPVPARTEEFWIATFNERRAIWIHDGAPRRPHVVLSTGKHSLGYFNSRLVTADEEFLREAVSALVGRIADNIDITLVDRVVGPQTGGTKLAKFISDEIGWRRKVLCNWSSPHIEWRGREKIATLLPGYEILRGESILLCDDVMSTGKTVELAANLARAVEEASIWPVTAALVNRSGCRYLYERRSLSLIDRSLVAWFPDECPLCKEGKSEAIRNPKDPDAWARLNARYLD